MTLCLAIVGRPNVGKSTLFNRLAGRRLALVDDAPGLTRDWREAKGRIGDLAFSLRDTPGLEEAAKGSLPKRMTDVALSALEGVDLVLFVIDAQAGLTPQDQHVARLLRKLGRPVVLVANKAENARSALASLIEAERLGFGEPVALSAAHGEGLADLYAAIRAHAPEEGANERRAERGATKDEPAPTPARPLKLAILGRPNVGKSSLFNRLFGAERSLAGPEAGLTRDTVKARAVWQDRAIELIDTAGLRRRAKRSEAIERMAAADALRALKFAHVAVVVLNATEPPLHQDLTIAAEVADEGRAIVIALNKWDLVEDPQAALKKFRLALAESLSQIRGVRILPCSAATGEGLERLKAAVLEAEAAWNKRVATADLNRWLVAMLVEHPPPLDKGKSVRIRYLTQTGVRPPTFAAFVNRPAALPESYTRYLVNGLREAFGLDGVPVRFSLRKRQNPYAKDES